MVQVGDSAYGELVAHWPSAGAIEVLGDSMCRARREAEERLLAEQVAALVRKQHGCEPVVSATFMQACRVRFAVPPGWTELFRRSDNMGIWTYHTSVPWQVRGLDGVTISVELRDSTGYRGLAYHSPGAGSEPGERELKELNALLLELLSGAPPPP
jgi:hypothetical protein